VDSIPSLGEKTGSPARAWHRVHGSSTSDSATKALLETGFPR
jgi:hypothetical protein